MLSTDLLPCSVVCVQRVCPLETTVSPTTTAEPIEMLPGVRTWVVQRNCVLDGGLDPTWEKATCGISLSIVKYREYHA